MTPRQLKKARERLGLTLVEAAKIMETDVSTVGRWERDPKKPSYREAPARVAQLYEAMLYGWRPRDWPEPGTPHILMGQPDIEIDEDDMV